MLKQYYTVVEEFDSKKDYGIEIREQYAECLSVLKKEQKVNPLEIAQKYLNSFTKKPRKFETNKDIAYHSFGIANKIEMLKKLPKIQKDVVMAPEQFYKLETIHYFIRQHRGSRYKNIKPKNDAGTANAYGYKLWQFNNWLAGKTFEFYTQVQIGEDTFRRKKKKIQIQDVEHLLKMYQEPFSSKADFLKVIKEYLMDSIHEEKRATVGGISPHSRCGTGEYDLFECKKPQLVEHGGNVNVIDRELNLNSDDVGVSTINKSGQPVSLSGSSFSSPLFIRRLIDLERVYRDRISNVETLLAISYLSCTNNISDCAGYGEPKSFTHTDYNSTVYFAEGIIGFTQVGDNTMTMPINDIIIYVPAGVSEIKFCLTHSDNFNKAVIPTLETYFEVKARKFGNTSLIPPENQEELTSKTNVKILTYKFDSKSMESMWTFSIRPRVTHTILTEDKRSISARFGCAILLTGKSDRKSSKPLTQEIIENRERFSS